ncbi:hypothetical protein LUZ61_010840 [Rhynchospora tenuis]|uniref:NB-ARC domain-containing protein n=1 Tax=Rhynchospora tenuis TaxID=198213 RepID=A0AAD5ZZZ5_9POAL|nr:hypothetical protein LUZ61_010840 [Rhynchospora tenuis]
MAEVAAFLTPLGWVASPLMKMLFDKGHNLLGTSIDERQKILAATALPRLSLAIEKAEKSPNKKLESWLKRLKDAYYKAEETIDLLEYQLLKKKVMDNRKTCTRICLPFQSMWRILIQKVMLKGRIDKLIEISKEAKEFHDLLEASQNATASNSNRDTTSQHLDIVFGRDTDRERVAALLTKQFLVSKSGLETIPAAIPVLVIAITGRSGIGKTTLAQYVYQYVKEQKYFDILLWVHCSRKFSASDVVMNAQQNKKASEGAYIGNHNPCVAHIGNHNPCISLEALTIQMNKMLDSKKFLLVLDDFWCDTDDFIEEWEKFIPCLISGLPGSKILLTTQSDRAVKKTSLPGVTEIKHYPLHELEEGQFFKLFMHHAWPRNRSLNKENFEIVGHKITAKLKGDPGATKIVGRQLRENIDITHWNKVAEKDCLGDNMKARIWSYQQLPVHLQRCFAICCLFQTGYMFRLDKLIGLWMALGLIETIDEGERMEDIGQNYLNDLVSRFFLEQHEVARYGTYYQLHDLLHDLAERVQGDDFIRIDYANSRNIPEHIARKLSQSENIRHISLPASMIIELKDKICLMKNLRTLMCTWHDNYTIPGKILQEILKNKDKLRFLELPPCSEDLPDCFRNLKHLRFLNVLGYLPLKKLPASIGKLYLLQMLAVPSCETMPKTKTFSGLVSLRNIYATHGKVPHISDVGMLTSLQILSEFSVRKERGHEIHQLGNLNELRGRLCITGLENVTSTEDVVKAKIGSKRHLEELEIQWNSNERVVDDFDLLKDLQPHPDIKVFKIKGFRGNRFPNWFLNQNSLKKLTELQLTNCMNLKELPLLPVNLTSLSLHYVPQLSYFSADDLSMKEERKQSILESVKQLTSPMKSQLGQILFNSVETPIRRYIQFVKERIESPSIYIMSSQFENIFQVMKNFDSWNKDYSWDQLLDAWEMSVHCHFEIMLNKNKESKLVLPSSLTFLVISACSITNDALSTCIQCLDSLTKLSLVEIQTITSFPPKEALRALKNLRYLYIKECYMLSSLGGISALTSLTELNLIGCLNLSSSNVETLPSSLEVLKFVESASVDFIINNSSLPVLRVLHVMDVCNAGLICKSREKGVLNLYDLTCLQDIVLQGWDGGLQGLNSLTSLSNIEVNCSGIDLDEILLTSYPIDGKRSRQIETVKVDHPLRLRQLLTDKAISLVKKLLIGMFEGNSIDDEVFGSLTSLERLCLDNCTIKQLPQHLENLVYLQNIQLQNCPNLHELKSLPKNLRWLTIKNCPTLLEKFNNDDTYEVFFHDDYAYVRFPTEGHTVARPSHSQSTQQADTWQPNQPYPFNPLQLQASHPPADQHQSSTSTAQRYENVEATPHDSPILHGPPKHNNLTEMLIEAAKWGDNEVINVLTELLMKGKLDEAGPSGTADEYDDEDDDEEREIALVTRRRRLLQHTP